MLNLPIVSLFFKSHLWLRDANKQIQFLKMNYVENLIVTEKSTSITFFECFLKHDVCATIHILWQSNWFCHFYRKHTVLFKILSIHLAIYCYMRLTNTYRSKACGASNFQIYNVLFYMLITKDLSYYPLLLICCSDLPNITF